MLKNSSWAGVGLLFFFAQIHGAGIVWEGVCVGGGGGKGGGSPSVEDGN